jgi:hypothetical protein
MRGEGFVLRDVDYDDENSRMHMLREIQCPYENIVVSSVYDEYGCLINFQQNIYIEESKY